MGKALKVEASNETECTAGGRFFFFFLIYHCNTNFVMYVYETSPCHSRHISNKSDKVKFNILGSTDTLVTTHVYALDIDGWNITVFLPQ